MFCLRLIFCSPLIFTDVSSYVVRIGNKKPCIVPLQNAGNITKDVQLTVDSECSGKNFMFHLLQDTALVHTLSGYCFGLGPNSTAILTKSCRGSRFTYQTIVRRASENNNMIIKDTITNKCIRLKRSKNKQDVNVIFKKCSDISQILMVLSKTGMHRVFILRKIVETQRKGSGIRSRKQGHIL